jgi:hypothetical protein
MPALRRLPLSHWDSHAVLLPSDELSKPPIEGICITVFGDYFPIRAVEPEILVGDLLAERVQIALDQRSISGFFWRRPPEGQFIRVRYGDSQEGELEQRFSFQSVRPLQQDCG